jgi:hypothetical protein
MKNKRVGNDNCLKNIKKSKDYINKRLDSPIIY